MATNTPEEISILLWRNNALVELLSAALGCTFQIRRQGIKPFLVIYSLFVFLVAEYYMVLILIYLLFNVYHYKMGYISDIFHFSMQVPGLFALYVKLICDQKPRSQLIDTFHQIHASLRRNQVDTSIYVGKKNVLTFIALLPILRVLVNDYVTIVYDVRFYYFVYITMFFYPLLVSKVLSLEIAAWLNTMVQYTTHLTAFIQRNNTRRQEVEEAVSLYCWFRKALALIERVYATRMLYAVTMAFLMTMNRFTILYRYANELVTLGSGIEQQYTSQVIWNGICDAAILTIAVMADIPVTLYYASQLPKVKVNFNKALYKKIWEDRTGQIAMRRMLRAHMCFDKPLGLSCCGLFPLDLTLLPMVIGAALSYLIIIIQLDMGFKCSPPPVKP